MEYTEQTHKNCKVTNNKLQGINMKYTQVITGCALAVGLMAVAASQVHAGVVIGSTLYAPVNVKATVTYVDDNGKFKKMSFSTKDVLQTTGQDAKGNQLATMVSYPGNIGGIYVVNSKDNTVVTNLVAGGWAWSYVDTYISTSSDKNNSFKESQQGYLDLYFYDAPGEVGSYMNIYGNYSGSYSEKYNNNNPNYNAKFNLKANKIQAEMWDNSAEEYYPGTGSVSANGSGKLTYVL
jgi:hypothetical protein